MEHLTTHEIIRLVNTPITYVERPGNPLITPIYAPITPRLICRSLVRLLQAMLSNDRILDAFDAAIRDALDDNPFLREVGIHVNLTGINMDVVLDQIDVWAPHFLVKDIGPCIKNEYPEHTRYNGHNPLTDMYVMGLLHWQGNMYHHIETVSTRKPCVIDMNSVLPIDSTDAISTSSSDLMDLDDMLDTIDKHGGLGQCQQPHFHSRAT